MWLIKSAKMMKLIESILLLLVNLRTTSRPFQAPWRKLYLDFFISGPDTNSSVYIVLDGIDEANDDERKIFLELAKDIMDTANSRPSRIQLAMVGRPQMLDQILEALEQDNLPTIHVTGDKTSGDIVHYIQRSIKNAKYNQISPTRRQGPNS